MRRVRLLVAAASSAHKVACVRREVCKVQSPDDLHPMAVWKKQTPVALTLWPQFDMSR